MAFRRLVDEYGPMVPDEHFDHLDRSLKVTMSAGTIGKDIKG
jgi:hypothetical protein